MASRQLILNPQQIERKLHRLAFQLLEDQMEAPRLTLAGITGNGALLARRVAALLSEHDPGRPHDLVDIHLDKRQPSRHTTEVHALPEHISGPITIVDDVLNTGRTMAYAMTPFLERGVGHIKMLVLVNRDHLHFPLAPDYVGMSLATQRDEHVEVSIDVSTRAIQAFLQKK